MGDDLGPMGDDLGSIGDDLGPMGDDLRPMEDDLGPTGDDLGPMGDDWRPSGVERLQVIETPTRVVAARRILYLLLFLSSACPQPQPLQITCFEEVTTTSSLKNPCTSGVKALWCFTLFGERRPLTCSNSADCLWNSVWSARNS